MALNLDIQKVYEVLQVVGPFVHAVDTVFKEAGIRTCEDLVAAKARIENGNIAGLQPALSESFKDFIAWHDNFRILHEREPSVRAEFTKKAFDNFKKDQEATVRLARLLPDLRRLQNSTKQREISEAKEVYSQIKRLRNGTSRVVDIETAAIMDLLPDELKNNPDAKFNSEGCVREIVAAVRVEPFSTGINKNILIPGMTQIGKTKAKAIEIIAGMYLGIPSIVLTHGNDERNALASKLLKAVADSNLKLDDDASDDDDLPIVSFASLKTRDVDFKKMEKVLQQKKTICIADTNHQVSAAVSAMRSCRERNCNMAFQIIIDECDAMFRTHSNEQCFENALKILKGLGPRVCSYVSATPLAVIPTLLQEEEDAGTKVRVFPISPGDQYVGLEDMKVFQINGKNTYLGQKELSCMGGTPITDEDSNDTYIPSCSNSILRFVDSIFDELSQGRKNALVLLAINPRVHASGHIFHSASRLQLKCAREGKNFAAIAFTGSEGIQVKKSSVEPWVDCSKLVVDNGKVLDVGKVIQAVHNEVGPKVPIACFAYAKMQRSITYRCNDRVPTHVVASLGPRHNLSSVAQTIGRGTFNRGKDKLRENGFQHVTLLTKRSDYRDAITMMNFLKEIYIKSIKGKSLRSALRDANKKYPSFLIDQGARQIGRLEGCNELLKDEVGGETVVSAGHKRKRKSQ